MLYKAGKASLDDDVPQAAAALSFYAVTALPPLVVVTVSVISLVYDSQQAINQLTEQIASLMGPSVAETVKTVFENRTQSDNGFAAGLGLLFLLVSASGFFAQLQKILNAVWGVRVKDSAGILITLQKRLLSMTTVLGTGLLLVMSLVFSAAVSAASEAAEAYLGIGPTVALVGQSALNILVLTLLFALIFKYLPDAIVDWKDVLLGALVTAVVFSLGKFGLALYLSRADLGADYGAAGALVLVMFWIYVSSMLVLFGAEYTELYARERGRLVQPEPHAELVETTRVEEQSPKAA